MEYSTWKKRNMDGIVYIVLNLWYFMRRKRNGIVSNVFYVRRDNSMYPFTEMWMEECCCKTSSTCFELCWKQCNIIILSSVQIDHDCEGQVWLPEVSRLWIAKQSELPLNERSCINWKSGSILRDLINNETFHENFIWVIFCHSKISYYKRL